MKQGIIIALLVIMAMVFVFGAPCTNVRAQEDEEEIAKIDQILSDQKVILQKLNAIDKKLDQLKMRIKM